MLVSYVNVTQLHTSKRSDEIKLHSVHLGAPETDGARRGGPGGKKVEAQELLKGDSDCHCLEGGRGAQTWSPGKRHQTLREKQNKQTKTRAVNSRCCLFLSFRFWFLGPLQDMQALNTAKD